VTAMLMGQDETVSIPGPREPARSTARRWTSAIRGGGRRSAIPRRSPPTRSKSAGRRGQRPDLVNPAAPPARYTANHRRAVRSGTPARRAATLSGTPSCKCGPQHRQPLLQVRHPTTTPLPASWPGRPHHRTDDTQRPLEPKWQKCHIAWKTTALRGRRSLEYPIKRSLSRVIQRNIERP